MQASAFDKCLKGNNMAVLESRLDTSSEQYAQNRAEMLEKLKMLDELYAEAEQGGGEEATARLRSRNKMPVRERISHVLDRDSPFLEISPLAAWRSNYTVGSGVVLGIGGFEPFPNSLPHRCERERGPSHRILWYRRQIP